MWRPIGQRRRKLLVLLHKLGILSATKELDRDKVMFLLRMFADQNT